MIIIGTSRKPTQRIRSFAKELARAIPGAQTLTRGKQGMANFLSTVRAHHASHLLLIGSYHGNPGRLGFLQFQEKDWLFIPPTILLSSVQLFREGRSSSVPPVRKLYVLPNTEQETVQAQSLARALAVPFITRKDLPVASSRTALLRLRLSQKATLDILSLDETEMMGPQMRIKQFLMKPLGDRKQW